MKDEKRHIEELANGSREAFEILYLRYSYLVERFVGALVKDDTAVDDISQEIFIHLWTRRASLKNLKGSFSSYLFAMSRNAVFDWFRRQHDSGKLPMESIDMSDIRSRDINKIVEDDELLALVNIALCNMPSRRKDIFLLSRVKGLKNREIAEVMGVSEKTVEYNIRKALEELRKISYLIVIFLGL